MTVSEAFEIFKSELELPDRKQREAAGAQQAIRSEIGRYLSIENSFLTGSYSRHTKINPLNDVDVFLVRNKQRTGLSTSGNGVYASTALDQVAGAVMKAFPLGATIRKQNRSVNVQMQGLSFGFDLTPAWLRTPDGYWIPESDSGNWIPSDPDYHAEMMTSANDKAEGKLKPLIKMVKHWSRNNYDRLSSFHIELICADIFATQEIENYQIGMAGVLIRLGKYVGSTMLDPVYGQCRVDRELSIAEKNELLLRVRGDAQRAIDAIKLERAGYQSGAIEKWKEVFLRGFPR